MNKHTIWVVPPDPVHSELNEVINNLADEYGSVPFEAHMTLKGDIPVELDEIKDKANKLAQGVGQLELELGEVAISTTYFQSVFVRVKTNAKLMELNMEAKRLFGLEENVFMPHISLMYGVDDMKQREAAANEVEIKNRSFIAKQFTITPSTLDPKDWQHLAEIPFT